MLLWETKLFGPIDLSKKVLDEDFAAVSTTFEGFLLGPPSVSPKSGQKTAAEQHLRAQEKKEEKSCEKRAVLIREGQLEKSNLEKGNFSSHETYYLPHSGPCSSLLHTRLLRIIAYLGFQRKSKLRHCVSKPKRREYEISG